MVEEGISITIITNKGFVRTFLFAFFLLISNFLNALSHVSVQGALHCLNDNM